MSGFLVTSTWGHMALIGYWAVILAVTLLAARAWIGNRPPAPVRVHQRSQHATGAYHRPTLDTRHRRRG